MDAPHGETPDAGFFFSGRFGGGRAPAAKRRRPSNGRNEKALRLDRTRAVDEPRHFLTGFFIGASTAA